MHTSTAVPLHACITCRQYKQQQKDLLILNLNCRGLTFSADVQNIWKTTISMIEQCVRLGIKRCLFKPSILNWIHGRDLKVKTTLSYLRRSRKVEVNSCRKNKTKQNKTKQKNKQQKKTNQTNKQTNKQTKKHLTRIISQPHLPPKTDDLFWLKKIKMLWSFFSSLPYALKRKLIFMVLQ